MIGRALPLLLAATLGVPQGSDPMLRAGTPIHLRTIADLTSKNAHVGDRFDLETTEPVLVDGWEAIPAGAHGVGSITSADEKSAFGKAGGLAVEVLYVEASGRRIRLHGMDEAHGNGGTGAAVVTTLLVGTFSAFVTGKSARMPKGTALTGYVARDLPLAGVDGR